MEHEILIWTKNKETGSMNIINHLKMSQEDVEEAALKMFKKQCNVTEYDEERFEYSAELDKTTH